MAHTLWVNPAILALLGENTDALKVLADWFIIEETYPNGTGRPTYMGRVAGAKKTGINRRLSGARIVLQVESDSTWATLDGNNTPRDQYVSLNDVRRRLAEHSITIELPESKAPVRKLDDEAQAEEPSTEPPPEDTGEAMDDSFRRLLPSITEHTLVLSLIDAIQDRKEKLFAQQRIAKYFQDFPELNIAPDETLVAALMINELTTYRLQRDVAQGKDVNPNQIAKAQENWMSAALALGVTRTQRLKQGDTLGSSIADLAAQYDELQRQALRQFERDIEEEKPIIERARERQQRELSPGTAEAVLEAEFGIRADIQRNEFAVTEEEADAPS